jgi:hypothetical protein
MTSKSSTQSVLDEMTMGIVGRKTEKAVKPTLTPVGVEKQGPLDGKHDVNFPYDDPQTVHQAIREGLKTMAAIQQSIEHIGRGLITLAQLYGLTEEQALGVKGPSEDDLRKQKEAAADERVAPSIVSTSVDIEDRTEEFEARIEEMKARLTEVSERAQADTFKPEVVSPVEGNTSGFKPSWACPNHGLDSIVTLTSRRGREYRACSVGEGTSAPCRKFEKEA